MRRGNSAEMADGGCLSADGTHLLSALSRIQRVQPPVLTRRHGILNLYWLSVEELGLRRGPAALADLVAHGYVRCHQDHPETGRITPAGERLLGKPAHAKAS